jgi:hypothetical protein
MLPHDAQRFNAADHTPPKRRDPWRGCWTFELKAARIENGVPAACQNLCLAIVLVGLIVVVAGLLWVVGWRCLSSKSLTAFAKSGRYSHFFTASKKGLLVQQNGR